MEKDELIRMLLRFRDKAFCSYTEPAAERIWKIIGRYTPNAGKIGTEWGHVKCGHGKIQSCQALNTEIKKAIDMIKQI